MIESTNFEYWMTRSTSSSKVAKCFAEVIALLVKKLGVNV